MIAHHRIAAPMLAVTFAAGVCLGAYMALPCDQGQAEPEVRETIEVVVTTTPPASTLLVDSAAPKVLLEPSAYAGEATLEPEIDPSDAGIAPCGGR